MKEFLILWIKQLLNLLVNLCLFNNIKLVFTTKYYDELNTQSDFYNKISNIYRIQSLQYEKNFTQSPKNRKIK